MAAKRPNLLFIFPDEWRQQALGCMRQDPVVTPNLDRLASEGMLLTHAVSNRPVCSPYRAMLFTGKYPMANHVPSNCNSKTAGAGCYLREDEICLTDVLARSGYCQGYIGKFHLDPPNPEHNAFTEGPRRDGVIWDAYTPPGPRRHGIDFWHAYGCCDMHMNPHYWQGQDPVEKRIEPKRWSVWHETDVALKFIRNHGGEHRDPDKPFALFLAHNPPHMPFHQVPPGYLSHYEGKTPEDLLNRPNLRLEGKGKAAPDSVKNYFAMITGIDEQIGRLLECLREEGLERDTIVVFTSDHGEMMGSHGAMGKTLHYDESLLIPFLIRWPGRIPARRDDLLLSVPDVMPSLLGLMGLESAIPAGRQGTDLSAAFLGRPCARPTSALYLDTWLSGEGGARGLRTHRHTLAVIRDADGQAQAILHDNEADPYQMKNIASENPALVKRLAAEMNDWLDRTGDPWPRFTP